MADLFPAARSELRWAHLSDCGTYRWELGRRWDDRPLLAWVMLNPSTADADEDDPTIRRVRGFTQREGVYGGFVVVNVWAFRATSPKVLHANRLAVEPENLEWVRNAAAGRDVVVAWGAHCPRVPARTLVVRELQERAARILCLGYTKGGEPRHPLMLRADTPLEVWDAIR